MYNGRNIPMPIIFSTYSTKYKCVCVCVHCANPQLRLGWPMIVVDHQETSLIFRPPQFMCANKLSNRWTDRHTNRQINTPNDKKHMLLCIVDLFSFLFPASRFLVYLSFVRISVFSRVRRRSFFVVAGLIFIHSFFFWLVIQWGVSVMNETRPKV